MSNVRTRFAPSPTGYIHVGNIRSALYPYFIAKQSKGKFILRIEDTDQNRFVEGAETLIIDTMQWLGLAWDEGPRPDQSGEVGAYGPYHQTDRRQVYHRWAKKLIDNDLAYSDPRTTAQLDQLKKQAQKNHRLFLYRNNRPDHSPAWDGSTPLRFKVTNPCDYHWHDEVMGDLQAGRDAVDDFIIIKSDGLPTYNFAHIVDDAEMKISHVIRGQEYLSSMPKYLALYDALDLPWPIFAHLPHIMAPSGNKKLGKRDGANSVAEYRQHGYLPETMINFLACLGWNDGTEQELFTLPELISQFSFQHVQRSGARFDEKRLLWMNGQWIKRLSIDDLMDRCRGFWGKWGSCANDDHQRRVLTLVQDRMKVLTDLPKLSEYFFHRPEVNWLIIQTSTPLRKLDQTDQIELLDLAIRKLAQTDFCSAEVIQTALNELLDETQQKPPILFGIIRFALTWAQFSPDLPQTMLLLGKDETIERLRIATESL